MKKLVANIRNRQNAAFYNVKYSRRRTFRLPERIKIGGEMFPISTLPDQGCWADFLTCFVEDEYGLRQISTTVKTVLDLGGNLGFFSLAARSRFASATIHCYEPNPRVQQPLSQNATHGGFNVYQEAIGASNGWVSIIDGGDSNQAQTRDSGTIMRTSLQEAISRLGGYVDLVKVDCEGAEWDLFHCSDEWKNVGLLRLEYHLWEGAGHTLSELLNKLNGLGFAATKVFPQGEQGVVWAKSSANR